MAGRRLVELDDDCLLTIMSFLSPLPDLISLSKSCRRFHSLTGDGRMRLLVLSPSSPTALTPEAACAAAKMRNCRGAYHTLAEAVQGSRPGDRIVLDPGVHDVVDVAIPWPLHLLGGGLAADDTVLRCLDSADCALDFRASGKLANLSIQSTANACITHRQGKLTVEACSLFCMGTGLNHLCAPIVTLATERSLSRRHGPAASAGVLNVIETRIKGGQGSLAVRTEGSGALVCVRLIHLLRGTLFWFKVDSAEPGLPQYAAPASPLKADTTGGGAVLKQEAEAHTAEFSGCAEMDYLDYPQPAWARKPASPSVELLEQRAKAWHLAHHMHAASLERVSHEDGGSGPRKRQRRL